MGEPLENLYFNWLCAKVVDSDIRNYHDLLVILHKTEFVWVVSADKHRADDGIELRIDFLRETQVERDAIWEAEPCSLLELFVAFAKRAKFQTSIPTRTWFWEFMNNLKLDDFRQVSERDSYIIDDILYTFIWRQYDPSGNGGLFPISRSKYDQRKIELWYQFSEYVEDRGLF